MVLPEGHVDITVSTFHCCRAFGNSGNYKAIRSTFYVTLKSVTLHSASFLYNIGHGSRLARAGIGYRGHRVQENIGYRIHRTAIVHCSACCADPHVRNAVTATA